MTCIHIQVGTLNTRASPQVSKNLLGGSFENAGCSVVTLLVFSGPKIYLGNCLPHPCIEKME